jgi:hypothetical protein
VLGKKTEFPGLFREMLVDLLAPKERHSENGKVVAG